MPIKWPYLISLIIIIVASFYFFYPKIENFFIFFPEKLFDQIPSDVHLIYEDVFFHTEDGRSLHGWFFPLEEESPVILLCHGNAGNISHRLDLIRLLLKRQLQVFIFDYRGCGNSQRRVAETKTNLDS